MIRADTKKDYELLQKYQYQALEIERLNNIIKNTAVELEILLQSEDFKLITMQLRNIVFRLKGSDKQWTKIKMIILGFSK